MIIIYYIIDGDTVRCWDKELAEYGQFEVVTKEYFELLRKCPFLKLVEELD